MPYRKPYQPPKMDPERMTQIDAYVAAVLARYQKELKK